MVIIHMSKDQKIMRCHALAYNLKRWRKPRNTSIDHNVMNGCFIAIFNSYAVALSGIIGVEMEHNDLSTYPFKAVITTYCCIRLPSLQMNRVHSQQESISEDRPQSLLFVAQAP